MAGGIDCCIVREQCTTAAEWDHFFLTRLLYLGIIECTTRLTINNLAMTSSRSS